eukprot:353681-Chlamydomonas_euryale.AAC.5
MLCQPGRSWRRTAVGGAAARQARRPRCDVNSCRGLGSGKGSGFTGVGDAPWGCAAVVRPGAGVGQAPWGWATVVCLGEGIGHTPWGWAAVVCLGEVSAMCRCPRAYAHV